MSSSFSSVVFGRRRSSIVPSHISARLKEHIDDAMPTAMPRFGDTRMFGNFVGRRSGSVIVLS